MKHRSLTTGTIFMGLLVALGTLGIVYGLWSKVLVIKGVVETGDLDVVIRHAYTDDDDGVDDPLINDPFDTASCKDVSGSANVDQQPPPFPQKDPSNTDGLTSCDPAETGPDIRINADGTQSIKRRYPKDVARCDATVFATDNETALVQITNGYPSYHCTAWFDLFVNGTIPVHVHGFGINGVGAVPCETGSSTPFDLNGDGKPDVEICLSGGILPNSTGQELQLHPGDLKTIDLDIHVMQDAPQGATLSFAGVLCVHQFNEEVPAGSGFCGPNPEHASAAAP